MSSIEAGTYQIDGAHTNVEFSVRHMMITNVKGRFADVRGVVEVPAVGAPRIDVTIGAGSVDTRNEQRDTHLRSADFFDVERYPELRFTSTRAARRDGGWTVEGDLTMHGVTRPVTLTVEEEGKGIDPWGNQKVAFSATGKLNRKEFGLNWNAALETGGVLVGDDVKLSFDVQLVRQAAQVAA